MLEKLIWTRALNEIDKVKLLLPKGTESTVVKNNSVSFSMGDRKLVLCLTPLGKDAEDSRWLLGEAVTPEFSNWLRSGQLQTTYFQKSRDQNWQDMLAAMFGAGRIATLDTDRPLVESLSPYALLIRKSGQNNASFFNSVVEAAHSRNAAVQGWTCSGAPGTEGLKLKFLFYHENNVAELPGHWHSHGVIERPLLHHRFIFSSLSTFEADGLMDRFFRGDGGELVARVYRHNNMLLKFHRLQVEVEPPKNSYRATLELVPISDCSNTQNSFLGTFKKTDGEGRWVVALPSPFDKELTAIPRTLSLPDRGVFVPPKAGDPVLIHVDHGGDVFAEFDGSRSAVIKELEKYSAAIHGDSVAVWANECVTVAAKASDQIVVQSNTTNVEGNFYVKGESELGK